GSEPGRRACGTLARNRGLGAAATAAPASGAPASGARRRQFADPGRHLRRPGRWRLAHHGGPAANPPRPARSEIDVRPRVRGIAHRFLYADEGVPALAHRADRVAEAHGLQFVAVDQQSLRHLVAQHFARLLFEVLEPLIDRFDEGLVYPFGVVL